MAEEEVQSRELIRPAVLAGRWNTTIDSLAQWRLQKKGPVYVKIVGKILYRISDIEKYEEENSIKPVIKGEVASDK